MDLNTSIPLTQRLFQKNVHQIPLPERVRRTLEALGPTFVKFGQVLSTRPDLIPLDFIKELTKLQDQVKPFSYHLVEARIQHDFQKPIHQLFKAFDKEPLASASLGQVHRAKLKTGEDVIVKMLRPGIKKTLQEDMDILHYLAEKVEKHFPKLRFYNFKGFVDEFEQQLRRELNYKNEARFIDRFKKNFADDPTVVVPQVHWKYTTEQILTMEYLEGIKITELTGNKKKLGRFDKKSIATHFIQSMFKQIFDHHFFHADPHPGNIMVTKDQKLVYLDFGMMQEVDEELDEYLENMFLALLQKDAKALTEEVIRYDGAEKPINEKELLKDVQKLMGEYGSRELGDINLGRAVQELTDLNVKYEAQIPKEAFMLGKALGTVQGICRELDPGFNVGQALNPVMQDLLKKRLQPSYITHRLAKSVMKFWKTTRNVPRRLDKILRRAEQGDITVELRHRDLEEFELELDRSSNRIALGYITGAFVIASALIMSFDLGPKIYGISAIAFFGFIAAGLLGFWLATSILHSGRF
ncbi:TPA: AarF/ABC1/UbiB kinase family protein [Candidatus Woesearchaeota archaeon]|nr:AarF/ABC1/UbiB kinase family protein [Candidatus Woesearchaeota archaeon]